MKSGQSSIEFLFAIGFVILLFLIILGFSLERQGEIKDTKEYLSKRNECLKISDLITGAFINGEGTLINTIIEYNIEIQPDSRSLCIDTVCCSILIDAVSDVNLNKGEITIENKNNFIIIKNV